MRQGEAAYFRVLCLGGGFALTGSAISGLFSGLGRPWPVMWVHTLATAVNVIFNYALIFGNWGFPELGIVGAGLATVISGFFAMVLFASLALAGVCAGNTTPCPAGGSNRNCFCAFLNMVCRPESSSFWIWPVLRFLCCWWGRLGMVSLAATNIAFNINLLAFMPMIGSGIAISVLVGQYLGRTGRIWRKNGLFGIHITLLYMATVAAMYVLVPRVFILPFAAQADPDGLRKFSVSPCFAAVCGCIFTFLTL